MQIILDFCDFVHHCRFRMTVRVLSRLIIYVLTDCALKLDVFDEFKAIFGAQVENVQDVSTTFLENVYPAIVGDCARSTIFFDQGREIFPALENSL